MTLLEALAGLALGGGVALLAALLMARWRWLERAVLPIAIVTGFIGVAIALVAVTFALLIPLAPFIVIGICVWLLTRNSRAATAIQG